MKICVVAPSFTVLESRPRGGTETYLEILAKALLARGHTVHVVVYGPDFPKDSKPALPVTLHVVKLRWVRYVSAYFPGWMEGQTLRDFVLALDLSEQFDVIEGSNDEGLHYFLAGTFGKRYWMRLHSSLRQHIENKGQPLTWPRRWATWLDCRAAQRSANLVTHSRHHAAAMAAEYGVPVERIHVIPHALATAPGNEPVKPLTSPALFAYIGTLDQRKGIDLFLKAIPLIRAADKTTRFLVIGREGGDSPAKSWQAWFQQTYPAQQPAVTFTGFVDYDALEKLWPTISVAVVPSRYESFGFVVIEAFQRGIPVLAANGGALPEVAQDGALLVAADDPQALADGAIRLLKDPAYAQQLAQRGKQLYRDNYTLDRFADRILALYAAESPA